MPPNADDHLLRSLITKACSLARCPDSVRTALAHYLATGHIVPARDVYFGEPGSREADIWWLFYTAVSDAAKAFADERPQIYSYWLHCAEDYFSDYCPTPSCHDDDPR